jgi:hypothetical protein
MCGFSLMGVDCAEISGAARIQVALYVVALLSSAVIVPTCIYELAMRLRAMQLNPVVLSLVLALMACTMNITWNGLGIWFITTAPSKPGFTELHMMFFFAIVIPATLSLTFAAVMVISLAWRKVVLDSDFSKTDRSEEREKWVRRAVIFSIVLFFGLFSVTVNMVGMVAGSIVHLTANLLGGIFFFHSGRKFQASVGSTFLNG